VQNFLLTEAEATEVESLSTRPVIGAQAIAKAPGFKAWEITNMVQARPCGSAAALLE
jgi:hypothetical protein